MTTQAIEALEAMAAEMRAELEQGASPPGKQVTVRDLLTWFDYSRRGTQVVAQIGRKLAEIGLRAVPDFQLAYIDDTITLELDKEATGLQKPPVEDPTVRIRLLPSAHRPPISVKPNDLLARATTIMMLEDFSQLPVMTNERDVKGVVTWRSISTASKGGQDSEEVRQCMEPALEVDIDAPFFDVVDDIWEHGYVLVRDRHRQGAISGIVTASDFARQFAELAQPFLIIGEIELHLRNIVSVFSLAEMTEASDDKGRTINGSADLNFGAYCRLIENPERWDRLGLNVDRTTFMGYLAKARETRNEIMHFAPDGLDPDDVEQLERLASYLRNLRRT